MLRLCGWAVAMFLDKKLGYFDIYKEGRCRLIL
jgi:hypothetical protein